MPDLNNKLEEWLATHAGSLQLAISLAITLCVAAVLSAVLINFISCTRKQAVKRERRSVVATGSMMVFFVLMYEAIRMQIGVLPIANALLRTGLVVAGLTIIVIGCVVNIRGRLQLGRNWANQATIYDDQKLVLSGAYALVRHPLYASMIWMFYGASMVYGNAVVFLANSFVFLPFLTYRARLEEALLSREFTEYEAYKKSVGMFFPRRRCGGKPLTERSTP